MFDGPGTSHYLAGLAGMQIALILTVTAEVVGWDVQTALLVASAAGALALVVVQALGLGRLFMAAGAAE